ncbi:MAG: S-layer protein, partial [Akkermansiaceae bacterium]|nr:S-layer protein [Akkermansiaceae bacterium]
MNVRMVLAAGLWGGLQVAAGGAGLVVQPAEVTLDGPESSQRVLVLRTDAGGEVTGEAASGRLVFVSSDPAVAIVKGGAVVPIGNGTATITALLPGEGSARAAVGVRGVEESRPWSFRNHVLPVISRAGCNAGACHGALAGKGGFRLSLRGYDPEADFHTITREARGRRIEPADPGRSLLLTKSTTALKHTGGKRIEPGSRDYRIIAEWITSG